MSNCILSTSVQTVTSLATSVSTQYITPSDSTLLSTSVLASRRCSPCTNLLVCGLLPTCTTELITSVSSTVLPGSVQTSLIAAVSTSIETRAGAVVSSCPTSSSSLSSSTSSSIIESASSSTPVPSSARPSRPSTASISDAETDASTAPTSSPQLPRSTSSPPIPVPAYVPSQPIPSSTDSSSSSQNTAPAIISSSIPASLVNHVPSTSTLYLTTLITQPNGNVMHTTIPYATLQPFSGNEGNIATSKPSTGSIVGGVLGGIAALVAIIAAFFLLRKRRARRSTSFNEDIFLPGHQPNATTSNAEGNDLNRGASEGDQMGEKVGFERASHPSAMAVGTMGSAYGGMDDYDSHHSAQSSPAQPSLRRFNQHYDNDSQPFDSARHIMPSGMYYRSDQGSMGDEEELSGSNHRDHSLRSNPSTGSNRSITRPSEMSHDGATQGSTSQSHIQNQHAQHQYQQYQPQYLSSRLPRLDVLPELDSSSSDQDHSSPNSSSTSHRSLVRPPLHIPYTPSGPQVSESNSEFEAERIRELKRKQSAQSVSQYLGARVVN